MNFLKVVSLYMLANLNLTPVTLFLGLFNNVVFIQFLFCFSFLKQFCCGNDQKYSLVEVMSSLMVG